MLAGVIQPIGIVVFLRQLTAVFVNLALFVVQGKIHGVYSTLESGFAAVLEGVEPLCDIITGQGADHYQYRQHPDNGVTVIKNTKTGAELDAYYGPDSQAAQNVINAYGPHPASQGQPGQPQQEELTVGAKLAKAAAVGGEIFQASGLSTKPIEEEKKDNTLLYVGLGVGGALALGLLFMAARRRD